MADELVCLAASAVEYLSGKGLQKEADEHYKRDEAERAKKRIEEDLPEFKAKRLAKEEQRAQEEYDRTRNVRDHMKQEQAREEEAERQDAFEERLEEVRERGRKGARRRHKESKDEEMEEYEHFEK